MKAAMYGIQKRLVSKTIETGTVMLYWSEKGYGFIKTEKEGQKVFVHNEEVKKLGLHELKPGQRIKFRLTCQREQDNMVATDLELDSSSTEVSVKTENHTHSEIRLGRVISYNNKKGYGFIKPDDSDKNVFFHAKTLRLYKIPVEKIMNHRVRFQVSPGGILKKEQAVFIKLI